MTDVNSFRDDIEKYEIQLSQVQQALSITPEGVDRDNLLSLQSDILELIALTKESLKSAEGPNTSDNEDDGFSDSQEDNDGDCLAKEYALFQAELKEDELRSAAENEKSKPTNSSNIDEELETLEGMKCRAPYGNRWGGMGYHNAMISSAIKNQDDNISTINDIQVKVLFINPTHKEMLPCAYYLDGSCKFSEEKCHYSHGEVVSLSSLQEYREPDYSSIKMGSRVLVKEKNKIWHRSVVLKIPEKTDDLFRVKFETSGNITEIPIHDLLPLHEDELELSESSDESSELSDSGETVKIPSREGIIQQSLLKPGASEPLGRWEEHTRGIGSKLMARMGYIIGTGLGKNSDGRVIPVEATVLPAGRSLDHCMELRQRAGANEDLFIVERRMRRAREKMEKQRKKQYEKKTQSESNIFNFINDTLGDKPIDKKQSGSSQSQQNLKSETTRGLNVASFQIDADVTRLEKELSRLMNSLSKHTKGSIPYNNIVSQYNDKQNELSHLKSKQRNITAEQTFRKETAKLSIF